MSEVQAITERLNEIRGCIREWLEDVVDFPVVMADHSDPRPDGPHVSFKLLTGLIKLGSLDEKKIDKLSGKITIRGHREFTVAIEAVGNAVGPDEDLDDFLRATDMLQAAHLTLDTITVRNKFDLLGVAIVNEGSVTDISQILETETEPRALLEVVFRARFDIVDNPGYFDKAQLSGDFDTNNDGTTDVSTGILEVI